ncbi:ribbon-helix-helix domain-containing protein [Sphingomonas sp. R1]|uniref:ribbon-helix-helix domain-containing protein n=1 Tax=Sphingomonas sp. R1 TaxID=399176 RepID=UPI0022245F9A|nr:ribbon-helix-helix domain-containing protein [Sphingomonas sp. R1]UYY77035.1 ribbon-helix-helix domain-containing protein [Sphingomonas sp. R1]
MALEIVPPSGGFHGPVKRSITIAGHPTSISLEPIFWAALEAAAGDAALPLSALVAAIDHARISADDPPNLASAIRTWLMAGAARSAR